jgi:hypothetical protein
LRRATPEAPGNPWVVGGLGAEQPTNGIDRGGDVHVEVGIDITGDTRRSFYDGHGQM